MKCFKRYLLIKYLEGEKKALRDVMFLVSEDTFNNFLFPQWSAYDNALRRIKKL